jgi:rhodanese-related sulfurtransferase
MLAADEAAFFDEQLRVLGRFPAYYAHMGPINRAGPTIVGTPRPVPALPPTQVERLGMAGAVVVDTRERAEFAAGHLPGSVNIELTEAFSTYVGWLLPFDAPIVLVLPEPVSRAAEAAEEAVVQLLRIGYGRVVGRLAGGVETWAASGREVRSYPTATMRELFETRVEAGREVAILDVRQPAEWRDDGAIAGAERIFVADLPAAIDRLARDREWWVICTTGHRASMAASLLDAAGIRARLVGRGGVVGWTERFEAALGSAETAVPA